MAMVQVVVHGLGLDVNHGPVVLLKEADGERVLPIWIGHPEAHSIQMKLENQDCGRPLTHDLMKSVMDLLEARLLRVEITKLEDSTYYAELVVRTDAGEARIDARPSDSIALALRFDAPIWAEDGLFRSPETEQSDTEAGQLEETDEQRAERQKTELQRRLRHIDPSSFGYYRLGD